MYQAVIANLVTIGWAMLIFLSAYLANVTFSLWYNIKLQKEQFSREKLITGGLKVLTFVVGLTLLCISVTTLPLFANEVGWAIPEEYSDLFADLVIIGTVLLVSCKYIKEAFTKFTAILNAGPVDNVETVDNTQETEPAANPIGFAVGKDVTEIRRSTRSRSTVSSASVRSKPWETSSPLLPDRRLRITASASTAESECMSKKRTVPGVLPVAPTTTARSRSKSRLIRNTPTP